MVAQYRLDFLTPAGVKFAELGWGGGLDDPSRAGFVDLACTIEVNAPGSINAVLPGASLVIPQLEHLSQVELWRKDPENDLEWYRYFQGLYLKEEWERPELPTFKLTAPGPLKMLDWRIVNYPAGVVNQTVFTGVPAETVMKRMVNYNAGPNALIANGRKRNAVITGISVQADGGNGNSVDWYPFGDVLLSSLQDLALIAGGDFDLVKTGAQAWQFQWFTGQRGSDRTATVIFAVERGNMGDPKYKKDRLSERTVACVWGQGEEAARDYVTRTSTDYSATNDKEIFVDARNVPLGATAGLNTAGDRKLQEQRARDEFSFTVLQTPACQYGKHYFAGDLVTVVNPFTGVDFVQKISAVTVGLAANGESIIDVELATP